MDRLLVLAASGLLACTAAADTLDGKLLVDAAAQSLRAALGPHAQLRPLGTLRGIDVPPGRPAIEAEAASRCPGQRRARVDVRVRVGGQQWSVPVWFAVLGEPQAVLARPMAWVLRQKPVTVQARVADVVVESPALALADGREGELVQVRLAAGGPIRHGRVVAPGRVAL